jgi:hypothetical protein
MRYRGALASVITLIVFDCACSNPAGIADFTSESQKALAHGPAILGDIHESCVRRHVADLPMGDFRATPDRALKACAELGEHQKGLRAASDILTDYFAALTQLARSDSATVGKDAEAIATNVSGQGQLGAAVGGLASFLARVAVEGYKEKHLAADVEKADPSVAVVADALSSIVQNDYLNDELVKEQQALTRRYESFLEDTVTTQQAAVPIAKILLQDRWASDLKGLAAKRAAASAYVAVLKKVSSGHHALASYAGKMSMKDLPGLLKTYTDSLAALTLAMQKSS